MQQSSERGLTLAAYAEAKDLPVEFLQGLGVSEIRYLGAPAVRIPYVDHDGTEAATRFRVSLNGDDKFRWKKGDKPRLYGLARSRKAQETGYVFLVEGESDCQTLWHRGYPAVALPGAALWREERDAPELDGIDVVYVYIEPDRGGDAVLRWLSASRIRERVRLVTLEGVKDVSELHTTAGDQFADRLEGALQAATPWAQHESVALEVQARQAWRECSELAREPRILDRFEADVARAGLAGGSRREDALPRTREPIPVAARQRCGEGAELRWQKLRGRARARLLSRLGKLRIDGDERTRDRVRH